MNFVSCDAVGVSIAVKRTAQVVIDCCCLPVDRDALPVEQTQYGQVQKS